MLSFRVHGEPAFADAVVLLVEFQYAPEAGEGDDAEDDARVFVRDEKRGDEGDNAGHKEGWPALLAEVVFALDDQGVEHSDAKEGSKAYEKTNKIHISFPLLTAETEYISFIIYRLVDIQGPGGDFRR